MALRLAFLGTPDFAVPTLQALLAEGYDLRAVYSQPPRPKGRGLGLEPSPVAKVAEAHSIPVRTPARLKSEAEHKAFADLALDAAVVVAYGLILPKAILDASRLGCFNLHGSLLPRWRGAAPIQRAIMAGDAETGAMVMHMDEGLDTGAVLSETRTPIGRKTFGELHDELAARGAELMAATLRALEDGEAREHPQPADGASYAQKILKEEARIDWTKSAREVDCHIRGLSPFPGAWCELGRERVKALYAEPSEGRGAPGTTLDDRLLVACGDSALRLTRLQRAGRAPMKAEDLLRGFAIPRGTQLA